MLKWHRTNSLGIWVVKFNNCAKSEFSTVFACFWPSSRPSKGCSCLCFASRAACFSAPKGCNCLLLGCCLCSLTSGLLLGLPNSCGCFFSAAFCCLTSCLFLGLLGLQLQLGCCLLFCLTNCLFRAFLRLLLPSSRLPFFFLTSCLFLGLFKSCCCLLLGCCLCFSSRAACFWAFLSAAAAFSLLWQLFNSFAVGVGCVMFLNVLFSSASSNLSRILITFDGSLCSCRSLSEKRSLNFGLAHSFTDLRHQHTVTLHPLTFVLCVTSSGRGHSSSKYLCRNRQMTCTLQM